MDRQVHARASGDDALAHGIKNELRNAVDIELLQNMASMSFDGGEADIQQVGDFLLERPSAIRFSLMVLATITPRTLWPFPTVCVTHPM